MTLCAEPIRPGAVGRNRVKLPEKETVRISEALTKEFIVALSSVLPARTVFVPPKR
jgi:hypothetical protein